MKSKTFLICLLLAVLGGCLPVLSLHSLHTEENTVFQKKLLGKWFDDSDNIWLFSRPDPNKKSYELAFANKEGDKGLFKSHLVRLQDRYFLNFEPAGSQAGLKDANDYEYPLNWAFLLRGHTFAVVDSFEPNMTLRFAVRNKKLEQFLKDHNDEIEYAEPEDRLILTSETEKLQQFILKYADSNDLFTTEMILSRDKAEDRNSKPKTDAKD